MTELASSLLHEASISWKAYGVSDVQKISPVYKTQHTLPLSVAGGSYPNQNYPVHASSSTPSHTNRLTIFMMGGEFIPYCSDREIYCTFVTTYYRPRWSSC